MYSYYVSIRIAIQVWHAVARDAYRLTRRRATRPAMADTKVDQAAEEVPAGNGSSGSGSDAGGNGPAGEGDGGGERVVRRGPQGADSPSSSGDDLLPRDSKIVAKFRNRNHNLRKHGAAAVSAAVKHVLRTLQKAHASACDATGGCRQINRNLRLVNEELTDLSVELMEAASRLPPFLSVPSAHTEAGHTGRSIFESWESYAAPLLHQSPGLYQQYLHIPGMEASEQIMRDVGRTLSSAELLSSDEGQRKLANVLHAYSLHDAQVSYVQGMNMLAGFVLVRSSGEEERTFWLFAHMMQAPKYAMRRFFLPGMTHVPIACHQMSLLLAEKLPRIHSHFVGCQVQVVDWYSKWALTLFVASGMPLDMLDIVWCQFFRDGYIVLISTTLGALACCEQQLLTMGFDKLQQFLRGEIWQVVSDAQDIFAAAARVGTPTQKQLDRIEMQWRVDRGRKSPANAGPTN